MVNYEFAGQKMGGIKMIEDTLSMCCECKAIKIEESKWLNERDDQQLYQKVVTPYYEALKISHGYCPPCGKKAMDDLDKLIAQQKL
jgi:hypothetical protein